MPDAKTAMTQPEPQVFDPNQITAELEQRLLRNATKIDKMENWTQKLVAAEEETGKINEDAKNEDEERKSGCPSLLNLDRD